MYMSYSWKISRISDLSLPYSQMRLEDSDIIPPCQRMHYETFMKYP